MTSRIALITGGSRGLGRSMALHLARAGDDIILTYLRDEAAAHAVVAEIQALGRRATALRLDVADSRAFPAFAGAVGEVLAGWQRSGFDILVNNAGHGMHVPLLEVTEEQFDHMIAVHLKAPLFLVQALAPRLNDGGRILNISSGLARFTVPGASAYGAAKSGLEALTRYMARELAQRRIVVNTLAPGPVATDFNGGRIRDDANLNAWVSTQTAFGRPGEPDDIGAAAASILARGNDWVTGQRIEASGGIML